MRMDGGRHVAAKRLGVERWPIRQIRSADRGIIRTLSERRGREQRRGSPEARNVGKQPPLDGVYEEELI